jgi:AcrR family transcriptional regulator
MEADTIAPDAQHVGAHPHDGAHKRQQILDGARTVFLQDGFDGASMNDIARVAGVSKGTLYVYFESKEQLFEALIFEDKKLQAERMMQASEPDDAREYLREFGRRLIRMMTQPQLVAQVRVVIAATAKFPRLGRAFYEAGPCYGVRKLSERLTKLVAAGALEIDNIELAAQQFGELCKAGLFNRLLFAAVDAISDEEIAVKVDSAVDVFMRAYGPRSETIGLPSSAIAG